MILDESNYKVYFYNRCIKLSKRETALISYFLQNDGKKIPLVELAKHFNCSAASMQNLIFYLNEKIKKYANIVAKRKMGYYFIIKVPPKFVIWREQFFKEHKNTRLLLRLYEQKEILEKKIKILEKKIF